MAGETTVALNPAGNLQGYLTQENALILIFWLTFIIGLILVLVTLGFGVWYLTYRIRVRYYQIMGIDKNNKEILRFIGTDKAKLIKLKGSIYNLRFFWKRKKIEPPPSEVYLPTKKGYEIHIKTDGIDFDPMVLRANPGFETIPMHKRLWLIQTHKQAVEQYSKPNFWEKYGTLILTFGTIVLCLAAMGFTIWYVSKIAQQAINTFGGQISTAAAGARAIAPGS